MGSDTMNPGDVVLFDTGYGYGVVRDGGDGESVQVSFDDAGESEEWYPRDDLVKLDMASPALMGRFIAALGTKVELIAAGINTVRDGVPSPDEDDDMLIVHGCLSHVTHKLGEINSLCATVDNELRARTKAQSEPSRDEGLGFE